MSNLNKVGECGMSFESYSDEQLIVRLRSGENEIMDYILEKYKPMVRKSTNALYLMGGENEDLIQEGMIGLFKAVRDYDTEKENSFAGFAQLCISRQLYSALQASNRKKHQPLNTYVSFSSDSQSALEQFFLKSASSPEDWILEQEKLEELQNHLKISLSDMEQQVLKLYLEGINYIRISEIMEKTPKSIDNALQRIRQKIRQLQ